MASTGPRAVTRGEVPEAREAPHRPHHDRIEGPGRLVTLRAGLDDLDVPEPDRRLHVAAEANALPVRVEEHEPDVGHRDRERNAGKAGPGSEIEHPAPARRPDHARMAGEAGAQVRGDAEGIEDVPRHQLDRRPGGDQVEGPIPAAELADEGEQRRLE